MKIFVNEMPKSKAECPFCENDTCKICGMSCHIDDCMCLIPFEVSVTVVDDGGQNDKS